MKSVPLPRTVRVSAVIDRLHLPTDLTDEDRGAYQRRVGEDPLYFAQANRRALRFAQAFFPQIVAAAPASAEQLDELCEKRGALVRLRSGAQQLQSDAEDGGLVGLAMMGYLEDLLIDWFEDQLSGDLPEAAKQDLRGEFSEYFQLVRRDEDGELRAVAKGERRTAPIRAEISETEDRVERMETEQALRRGEKVEPTRVLAAAEAKRRPVEAREMPTAKAPGKGRNQRGKKR